MCGRWARQATAHLLSLRAVGFIWHRPPHTPVSPSERDPGRSTRAAPLRTLRHGSSDTATRLLSADQCLRRIYPACTAELGACAYCGHRNAHRLLPWCPTIAAAACILARPLAAVSVEHGGVWFLALQLLALLAKGPLSPRSPPSLVIEMSEIAADVPRYWFADRIRPVAESVRSRFPVHRVLHHGRCLFLCPDVAR